LATLKKLLGEEELRETLEKRAGALLGWDGQGETLLPLLTPGNLAALDEALRPRRRASRSLTTLTDAWQKCLTKAEFASTFENWLDSGENLALDDEILLDAGSSAAQMQAVD
jgi:hypothetical protein